MGGNADGYSKIEDRVEELRGKGWLQPPVTGPVSVKKRKPDFDPADIDEGEAEEGEEQEGWDDDEVDDEELLAKKKKLDLMVEYLRRVYNFCFFCVFESDSVHELARKCPGGHLRRPRAGLSSQSKAVARASALGQPFPVKKKEPSEEGEEQPPAEEKRTHRLSKAEQQLQRAFNWVRTFEDKLLQILEPDNVDIRKLGGKPVEEALEEELSKFVKQEDEAKFRCKVPECTKLFKAEHFWRKHVEKRHTEWFENIKSDVSCAITLPYWMVLTANKYNSSLWSILTFSILPELPPRVPMPTAMAISLSAPVKTRPVPLVVSAWPIYRPILQTTSTSLAEPMVSPALLVFQAL